MRPQYVSNIASESRLTISAVGVASALYPTAADRACDSNACASTHIRLRL